MDFSHQFEFIYETFADTAKKNGWRISKLGLAKYLGISQGRMQKWESGQIPRPDDLCILHENFGFSYEWLLTGRGEPFKNQGPESKEMLALKEENERLKAELAEADRLNRQLTTRLLIDGAGDKDAAPGIGKTADGQG